MKPELNLFKVMDSDGESEIRIETCPLCGSEDSFDYFEFEEL